MCCCWIPRDWVIPPRRIPHLIPALTVFLTWMTKTQQINHQTAVIDALTLAENELQKRYADENYWGQRKQMRLKMKEEWDEFLPNRPPTEDELQEMLKTFPPIKGSSTQKSVETLPSIAPADILNRYPTAESVCEDLSCYQAPVFPDDTMVAAIYHQETMIPLLLDSLDYVAKNYTTLDGFYTLHFYALFLLAQFREKRAFLKILTLLGLPDQGDEKLLGDLCTDYAMMNILASTYDGDIAGLHQLIMDNHAGMFSRGTGINALLSLYATQQLSLDDLTERLKLYLYSDFSDDKKVQSYLVTTAGSCVLDAYVEPLFDDVKKLLLSDHINHEEYGLPDLANTVNQGSEECRMQKRGCYGYIDDIKSTLGKWACFQEKPFGGNEFNHSSEDAPEKSAKKLGRNDPCLCGSGKKFKKCCLN